MNLSTVKTGVRGRPAAPVLRGTLHWNGLTTCMKDEFVFDFYPDGDLFHEGAMVVCRLPLRLIRTLKEQSVSVSLRFSDVHVRWNRCYNEHGHADILPLYFVTFVKD